MKPVTRRCPSCAYTGPGGSFPVLKYGAKDMTGKAGRRCPRCGKTGPTFTFRVVRL